MATLVRADRLGKRYWRGRRHPGTVSLRESVAALPAAVWRGLRSARDRGVESFWALRDVSFTLGEGEIVGLLGHNGAGKTTLLRLLSAVTEPTEGRAEIRGRVGSLLGAAVGFHPELTGRENIFLAAAIMGMTRAEVRSQFDAIVEFAEIGPFLETATKHYSSGMVMKLGFAIAVHLLPEVLILDEVLAVGDHLFQDKALRRTRDISAGGRAILLVSHNLQAVAALCTRVLILDRGQLVFAGDCASGIARYVELSGRAPAGEAATRTDRVGSGVVRCQRVAFVGPRGAAAISGEALLVTLEYAATTIAPLAGLRASLHFASVAGEPLFICRSDLRGARPPLPARGALECRLPQLPLAPGTYQVHAQLRLGDEVADVLEGAAWLEVEPGELGQVTTMSGVAGGLLVPQHWQAAPGDGAPGGSP